MLETKASTKGARQRLVAEKNNFFKGFAKGSGGTNDRSIIILTRETTSQKCTDNKRTTRVNTSINGELGLACLVVQFQ